MQSVISNLLISHVELRSEESPDIQAHSHQRSVEKVVVPLGEALSAYQTRYLQVGTSNNSVYIPHFYSLNTKTIKKINSNYLHTSDLEYAAIKKVSS